MAKSVAMTAISLVENIWMSDVLGLPWLQDVSVDFSPLLEYLPSLGGVGYGYLANYITHYVYGMW